MENSLNQEINKLNQQLKESKTDKGIMNTNSSDLYQNLKKIITGIKLIKDRMYDYVTPEQHKKFSNTIQNDSTAAAAC